MPKKQHKYPYGVIGNCAYMAHVDTNATVVWACFPRFDSEPVFSKLLDEENGGYFSITPASEKFNSNQYYFENTNVLCTEFFDQNGAFRVIDFAPRFGQYDRTFKPLMLFRKVEKIGGNPVIKVECKPYGGFDRFEPQESFGSNHIRYLGFEQQFRLTSSVSLNYISEGQQFILFDNEYFALTWGIPLEGPLQSTAESFLQKTIEYWHDWVMNISIPASYQGPVIRSSLILKLHQYEDTGAIIASGTTSLPEFPGSGRTWDYRFCWMRDSYYTLAAFNLIGHFRELKDYSQYIQNIVLNCPHEYVQPLYDIGGQGELVEREVNLPGYMGNKPVRKGNDAFRQIQNDVYGQVIVSILPLLVDQRLAYNKDTISIDLVRKLLGFIEHKIEEPDAGIWELRNKMDQHCYTYLFHWAGCKAVEKLAIKIGDQNLKTRSEKLLQKVVAIIESCYDAKNKVYTQTPKHEYLDASLFQLVTMGYLDPKSQKARDHLKALERELVVPESGLVYRYKIEDDFGEPEATFVICSFWYVEALACIGELKKAAQVFDNLLKMGNHLDLFSEDICPKTLSQWGNFPQTYSHVGLINAAFRICQKLDQPHFVAFSDE